MAVLAGAGLVGARLPSVSRSIIPPYARLGALPIGYGLIFPALATLAVVTVIAAVAVVRIRAVVRTATVSRVVLAIGNVRAIRKSTNATSPRGTTRMVLVACLGLFVVCSTLSERSQRGLRLPPELFQRNVYDAVLVADPSTVKSTVSVDARVHGKHLQLRANGAAARVMAGLSAGQGIRVRGRLRALGTPFGSWLRSRHIAGRLTVIAIERVSPSADAPFHYRIANAIRSQLLRSAEALPRSQQGLFAGFLLGDDRNQAPEIIDDFRAAGLSHLLVVSGQNVAFTLAVFEPFLRRVRRRRRLIATLALLLMFATVTRFEPSVLRAVAMAGVVAVTRCLGRPQRGLRVLSLAVIVLLVIDPLLSYSVGFALSMAATAGLALWSDPLSRRLPLPNLVRSTLAPTLAAQAGASIVMVPVFGTVPVVSLLANALVVPVAAPLMGWGVAAGLPAGLLGHGASRLVHLPTRVVLAFVAWAAQLAARIPLGSVGPVPLLLFGMVTWWACRTSSAVRTRCWVFGLVAITLWPTMVAVSTVSPIRSGWNVERGARLWTVRKSSKGGIRVVRHAPVLVVTSEVDVARLLGALRANRITSIDMVIVANGGRSQSAMIRALASRISLGSVVVADVAMGGGLANTVRIVRPMRSVVADLTISVRPAGTGKLDVQVVRGPVTGSAHDLYGPHRPIGRDAAGFSPQPPGLTLAHGPQLFSSTFAGFAGAGRRSIVA